MSFQIFKNTNSYVFGTTSLVILQIHVFLFTVIFVLHYFADCFFCYSMNAANYA